MILFVLPKFRISAVGIGWVVADFVSLP